MHANKKSPSLQWKDAGLFLLIYFCWLLGAETQLLKHFSTHVAWMLDLAAGVVIAALLLWLRSRDKERPVSAKWLWACWGALTLMFVALYPLAERRIYGGGSDREDALRAASLQLVHGHFPYYVHTFLGNPISPLPGALLLSAPFLALKYVGIENLFWLGLFLYVVDRFFRNRAAVLIAVAIMAILALGTLDDFVVGGDFSANFYYVLIAVLVFIKTHERVTPVWQQVLSEIFLGIALCSRAVYLVFLPLLFAYLLQQRKFWIAARAVTTPLLVAAALALPFYFYDPAHFAPLHIEHKLDFLPVASRALVQRLLMLAAFVPVVVGFLVRLTTERILLLAGISLVVVLGIPGILAGILTGFGGGPWFLISYVIPAVYLLALWGTLQVAARTEAAVPEKAAA
ncbi:MAG: hypothetical protein HIU93_16170 [Acidobacteria bacterium]|nr:hypothetical protein [Acidobacteriota bacterium]MBW4045478.1 hypothetical protein [Acidobacteriota bacterium]